MPFLKKWLKIAVHHYCSNASYSHAKMPANFFLCGCWCSGKNILIVLLSRKPEFLEDVISPSFKNRAVQPDSEHIYPSLIQTPWKNCECM